jgi:tripartite-type tricarboxylate transporter receptor subunit TctC
MKVKILFLAVLSLIVFCFFGGMESAWAKYPEKKIQFIAAFEPGGGSDLVARTLVRYVNPFLGGRIFVENIVGGAGSIGFRAGAKANPDGYTLTMIVTSLTVGPHVTNGFPSYDLFDPICIVAQDSTMLSVKMDSPFQTAASLIAYAKNNPEAVNVSVSGIGTPNYLSTAAFADAAGVKFALVPYKGTNPALVAAMGGHVVAAGSGCSEGLTFVEGKKLKPLVVYGHKRARLYPDVPTAKEIGYDVAVYQWRGVGVPRGTPPEIKKTLVEAFRKATEDESYKKTMDQMGLERVFLGPEESDPWMKAQFDLFKKTATKMGIQPQ